MTLPILTCSAVDAYADCPKKYELSYKNKIYPTAYSSPLSMGTATHLAVEALKKGAGLAVALGRAVGLLEHRLAEAMKRLPDDSAEAVREKAARDVAKTRAMIRAHHDLHHYDGPGEPPLDRELDFVAVERAYHERLLNPTTGRPSLTFRKAGKSDGIVTWRDRQADGLFVYELKTTSDPVDEMVESLRHSIQPATYQELATYSLAQPINGTVVDVIRKPSIRGRKNESLDEFEERCLAAYHDEPERFFARVEFPCDEGLLREAMEVFWQTARAIRQSDRNGYVAPRGRKCKKSFGWCEYKALCWYGERDGYRTGDSAHEELDLSQVELGAPKRPETKPPWATAQGTPSQTKPPWEGAQ